MYSHDSWGVCFGDDLIICNNSNTSNESYANFGHSYELPSGKVVEPASNQYFVGSDRKFLVKEIECYLFN
jgi:hypothetical protein